MTGLTLVYTLFQIPLMVIVFLPALDGLRQEWYDASASLGGSSWSFWRHVGGPILAPSFLGAVLLLFANAFSAYATAAALVSQGSPIVPAPDPRGAARARSSVGQANVGKALALGMIVIVVVVMALYALRPAARGAVAAMTGGEPRRRSIARWAIIILVGGYLLLPLVAMVEFSTRGDFGTRTLDAYARDRSTTRTSIDAIIADRSRSPR